MSKELQKTTTQALSEQEMNEITQHMMAHAGEGSEDIRPEDLRPPSIGLCQSMSPQRKKGDPKFIEGVGEGDFFNTLTGEKYPSMLRFVVVKSLGHTNVLFHPTERGVVLERGLPDNDPRCNFGEKDSMTGKSSRPEATTFHSYLLWLIDQQEMVSISFKGTQIKKAVQLNSLVKYPLKVGNAIVAKPPIWARMFELTSASERKDQNEWAGFVVKAAGIAPFEIQQLAQQLNEANRTKSFEDVVDVTTANAANAEDIDDSMAANGEGEA